MTKIRVDAQMGEHDDPFDSEQAGDPRLEYEQALRKHELGDESFHNPKNPINQFYLKTRENFDEFVNELAEHAVEFEDENPELAARIQSIISKVEPIYNILDSVNKDVADIGSEFDVGD